MESLDNFPAGLRVLAVDDDNTALKNLETILKGCNYQAMICNSVKEAKDMLGKKNEEYEFDVVMSDMNMSDGLKFIQHVALELKEIPVIMMSRVGEMMSVLEETGKVMQGIELGACEYLPKPITLKDVRFIWTHMLSKRIHRIKEGKDSYAAETDEDGLIVGLKRKELGESSNKGGECGDDSSSSSKKCKDRLRWTPELHEKFEKAVEQIGLDKATPKKILKLMGDSTLTREQIASHLQKYRIQKSSTSQNGVAIQENGGENIHHLQHYQGQNGAATQETALPCGGPGGQFLQTEPYMPTNGYSSNQSLQVQFEPFFSPYSEPEIKELLVHEENSGYSSNQTHQYIGNAAAANEYSPNQPLQEQFVHQMEQTHRNATENGYSSNQPLQVQFVSQLEQTHEYTRNAATGCYLSVLDIMSRPPRPTNFPPVQATNRPPRPTNFPPVQATNRLSRPANFPPVQATNRPSRPTNFPPPAK